MNIRMTKGEQARILRVEMRKRLIKEHGLKYSDFGDKGQVSRVIHEIETSELLRKKIAKLCKVSYAELWKSAA